MKIEYHKSYRKEYKKCGNCASVESSEQIGKSIGSDVVITD